MTLKACGDIPYLDYDVSMVKRIIPQESASYKDNLLKLKPDFVVHGDDWQHSYQKKYRTEVAKTMEWKYHIVR